MRTHKETSGNSLVVRDEKLEVSQLPEDVGRPKVEVVPLLPQWLIDEGWTLDMGKVIEIEGD